MDDLAKEYFAELVHNEKVRKRWIEYSKTGKFLDDDGNEQDLKCLGNSVNYELSSIIRG